MKNRKGNVLMLLGLLLLLAALLLVVYNNWDSNRAGKEADEALMALEQIRMQERIKNQQTAAPMTPVPTATPTPVPTDAPATDVPTVTDAPATDTPNVTDAPATDVPNVTDAPATDAPTPSDVPTATVTPTTNAPDATEQATATPTAAMTNAPTSTKAPDAQETPLVTATPTIPMPTAVPTATPDPSQPTTPPMATGALYERVPGMEMPGQQIAGHEYVGTLSIPALSLTLPVQRNWSYPNLTVSPCRYSGSAYAGEFVIIAHTYQSHFGKLSGLEIGSTVSFTDMEGNVFRYIVREKVTLNPTDTEALTNSGYDLTLATCSFSGSKRLAVRCEKQP